LAKEALERIAQLIQSNPAITVKQIAREMGYSEEKSVYYWLEKEKYYGIKEFKRAVLTGEFYKIQRRAGGHAQLMDRAFGLIPGDMPMARTFTTDGKPVLMGIPGHYSRTLGESVYTLVIRGNDYFPFLQADDLLVIDPEAKIDDGDLVVFVVDSKPEFRLAYPGNLYVHPLNPRDIQTGTQPCAGKVTHLVRSF